MPEEDSYLDQVLEVSFDLRFSLISFSNLAISGGVRREEFPISEHWERWWKSLKFLCFHPSCCCLWHEGNHQDAHPSE